MAPNERAVCPECGLPGVPIVYGLPSERGRAVVLAGLGVLGGCEIRPGKDEFACPRHHGWRGQGQLPSGLEPREASASRMYAAGDFAGAERVYRAMLGAVIQRRGERDPDARALRHALTVVLAAAGRAEDADVVYAPLRAMEREDMFAWLESWRPPLLGKDDQRPG